jgi:nitroreductase
MLTIMLLAVNKGLGTVTAAASVRCSEVLREKLGIPESKVIVLGILIGYPDTENPQFGIYSERGAGQKCKVERLLADNGIPSGCWASF